MIDGEEPEKGSIPLKRGAGNSSGIFIDQLTGTSYSIENKISEEEEYNIVADILGSIFYANDVQAFAFVLWVTKKANKEFAGYIVDSQMRAYITSFVSNELDKLCLRNPGCDRLRTHYVISVSLLKPGHPIEISMTINGK
jgi:hypothetical protein